MKIFEKIKIQLINGKSRQIRFLDFPILQYDVIYTENKKNKLYYFPFIKKNKNYTNKNKYSTVFYLKVNRNIEDTYINLQYWIDIVSVFSGDYYIICDDCELEKNILKNIVFSSSNIKFLKSKRHHFDKIIKKQKIEKCWQKACEAHLTVFDHAKKLGLNNFWNIDADDALFLISPTMAANFLKKAAEYAENNNLDAFGFDFWATKTKGRHWSFGITYTRNSVDYFEKLEKYSIDWSIYKHTTVYNIDWCFTHLKNIGQLKLKTFYTENLYFLHWGRFFGDMKNSYLATWHNGIMTYPILAQIFKDKSGIHPIPIQDDIIKLDYDIDSENCYKFAIEYLLKWKYNPIQAGELEL